MPVPSRPGLCSVTYRRLDPEDLVALAADAGLSVVEWGSDVHAPPGDATALARVRDVTAAAGLATCSYGTYFEAGTTPDEDFVTLADAAIALRAPRLRVWAGVHPSAATSAAERESVVLSLRRAADVAATRELDVALEFHGSSLTDTSESTLRLLGEIDRENVSTYWQAPIGMPDPEALDSLAAVQHHVSAVHVFAWSGAEQRHPLETRERFWRDAFALLSRNGFRGDALLEFVPDDEPSALRGEAATLRSVIA